MLGWGIVCRYCGGEVVKNVVARRWERCHACMDRWEAIAAGRKYNDGGEGSEAMRINLPRIVDAE